jgi:hypothetical protein
VAGTETLGFRPILAPPTISFSNRCLKGNVGSKQKLNLETWGEVRKLAPCGNGLLVDHLNADKLDFKVRI